jgi:two-component system chemotaxis response regulator CheY
MSLTRAGHEVVEAEDGGKGIEAIKSGDNPVMVDTILCDFHMPRVNGMEEIVFFRSQFPSVSIVVMTGHPDVVGATQLMKDGLVDYLPKPVSPQKPTERVGKSANGHAYKDPFKTRSGADYTSFDCLETLVERSVPRSQFAEEIIARTLWPSSHGEAVSIHHGIKFDHVLKQ